MMRRVVKRLAAATWLVAGGLSAAVAIRFAAGAFASFGALSEEAPAPVSRAQQVPWPPPSSNLSDSFAATQRRLQEVLPAASASLSGADAAPPAPLNVQILVDFGTPRSEVYVNGTRRGLTPYIGEVNCLPDAEVRVEVLPPKGLPRAGKLKCQPGVLRFGPAR